MRIGALVDDRFAIQALIGRGGMGTVYKALDRATGKPVALKVVRNEHEHVDRRLVLEAQALLRLQHPAVVRYVAHAVQAATPYLVMEWLEGPTLADRLLTKPLSLTESLTLAGRIASGLAAVHELGITHRDIKPQNLLLVEGRVDLTKILDFGVVRMSVEQSLTGTGFGIGTPEYMSPEQARGDKNVGPPADVFALGCVLFRCLSGKTAFPGRHLEAILAKIAMTESPPRVSEHQHDIPAAVDDLVAWLMAPRAAERAANGQAVLDRLGKLGPQSLTGEITKRLRAESLTGREQEPVAVIFLEVRRSPAAVTDDTENAPVPPPSMNVDGTTEVAPAPIHADDHVRQLGGPDANPGRFQELRHVLEPYGARVERLLDGSVVAVLGAVGAVTDLATSAARAAIELHRRVPEGMVGVALDRAVAVDRAALGPAIDRATGLARGATPGIRLNRTLRDLLPERFITEREEDHWVLAGERTVAMTLVETPRLLLGKVRRCVGRNRELGQLVAAWQGCRDDSAAHAIVVVGEAGMGKSRVLAEFLDKLRAEDELGAVFPAWGDATRALVPYGLLSRALRRRLAIVEDDPDPRGTLARRVRERASGDDADRLTWFLGELTDLPFPESVHPSVRAARQDPQLMADQRQRAFEDWVVAEARVGPLLLLVDDLQWADGSSVELLGAALRRVKDLPVMLLAVGRPQVHDLFPQLGDQWARQEIRLEAIRPAACEALVKEALGDTVDASIRTRLAAQSAGNPFYLEELIRAAAAGSLDRLPESVLAGAQLHLGRLPAEARHVLRAASVYGRVFWAGGVEALVGAHIPAADVIPWLERLEKEEVTTRRTDGSSLPGQLEYHFSHDLLRQAAYGMLTDDDRITGHRLAGQWLVGAGEADPVVLADHFAGGGAAERAIEWYAQAAEQALGAEPIGDLAVARDSLLKAALYYRRAAESAAQTYAHDSAISFYERAISLISDVDPVETARARLGLSRTLANTGQLDQALAQLGPFSAAPPDLELDILIQRTEIARLVQEPGAVTRAEQMANEAVNRARELSDRVREVRALCLLAAVLSESDETLSRAVQVAEEAVALGSDAPSIAGAKFRLACAAIERNDSSRALALWREALTHAESSEDALLEGRCLQGMSLASYRALDLGMAIAYGERSMTLYRRLGDRRRIAGAMNNVAIAYQLKGDVERARPLIEEGLGQVTGRDWVHTVTCQESLADIARQEGNEAEAQQLLHSAVTLCRTVDARGKETRYLGLLAETLWASGDFHAAKDCIDRVLELGEGFTSSVALLLARMGQYDAALPWLEVFRQEEQDPDRRVMCALVQARISRDREDTAAALALLDETLTAVAPLERLALVTSIVRGAMSGEIAGLMSSMPRLVTIGGRYFVTEAVLEIGESIARTRLADRRTAERLLSFARSVEDAGARYRALHLAGLACSVAGLEEESFVARRQAQQAGAEMLAAMPPDYRERLETHPWVVALGSR